MESTFLPTAILTLIVLTLAIIGFSLRMIFVKGGEFRGGCASNNPMLTNEIGECQVCGAKPGDECAGDEGGTGELPKIKD